MKCTICGNIIGSREIRSYVTIHCDGKPHHKLYACSTCGANNGPFDRLIDSLPIDDSGTLLNVSRVELEALKLATNRQALLKRLRAARSVLTIYVRRNFGRGRFDFDKRTLTGNNGMILRWKTRPTPDKPVTHWNQQTNIGSVELIKPTACED